MPELKPIKIKHHYPNDIVAYYKHQDIKPFRVQFKPKWKKYNDMRKYYKFHFPKIYI